MLILFEILGMLVLIRRWFELMVMVMCCIIMRIQLLLLLGILITGFLVQVI